MTTTDLPATPAVEAPVQYQATPASAPAPSTPATVNGFSVTALVLGIVGIVAGQWFLSVAAIVFGFVARNKEPQSRLLANWGLALGFVGAFGWLIVAIIGLSIALPFAAFTAPFWAF